MKSMCFNNAVFTKSAIDAGCPSTENTRLFSKNINNQKRI